MLVAQGAFGATRWVALYGDTPAAPRVTVLADSPSETLLAVQTPGYFEMVGDDGVPLFSLPGASWALEAGKPQVPRMVINLVVADAGAVTVREVTREGITIAVPAYRLASATRRGAGVSASVIQQPAEPFPVAHASCSAPYILRDVRGVIVAIHPFRYDSAKGVMQIATNLVLRVTTAGSGGVNVLARADAGAGESEEFAAIYRHQFLNYRERGTLYAHVPEAGRMLVIAADAFYQATLPWVYWKRQKGIATEIVPLSSVGATASNVQDFIAGYYASNGVTYVQLVGDADQLPYPPGTKGIMTNGAPADPRYVLLAGSDSFPEAFIGRFQGRTVADISNMVQRSIAYERTPTTNATWYGQACGVASTQVAGGLADYERMELIRGALTNFTYTSVDQIYDPGATLPALTTALNAGRSLVNYQGHGTRAYWATPSNPDFFRTTHILALSNTSKLPFVYVVGCRAGQYLSPTIDCHADAWLKAGTIAAPRGAVAVSAATEEQLLLPPTTAQAECTDLLVSGQFHTLGALMFNGMMKGVSVHTDPNPDPPGTQGEELYEQTHLFGDASLMLWTATPSLMAVAHAGIRYPGQGSYAVSVAGVPGARCALFDATTHTLVGAGTADGAGNAAILSTYTSAVPLVLTVTAFNRAPFIAPVAFATNYVPSATVIRVW